MTSLWWGEGIILSSTEGHLKIMESSTLILHLGKQGFRECL